uniref:Si:ch73-269m23.5 n=1 Tax=Amphilophus citrinellus TaxID=61819 RepID=A0A3Q0T2X7_AMPCI
MFLCLKHYITIVQSRCKNDCCFGLIKLYLSGGHSYKLQESAFCLRVCFALFSFEDVLFPPSFYSCWLAVGSENYLIRDGVLSLIKECPGQSFQAWHLLLYLKSSLAEDNDILLEPYLQSWDQLLKFMESLGPMVSFFSQKLIKTLPRPKFMKSWHKNVKLISFYFSLEAYRSVRSMMEAELKGGMVSFSHRTDSGCRTLLRLHRSLLWLKLMLEGLAEGPDADGRYKTPGELGRDAYKVALAPHHPWVLRQAAEFVFLALPNRKYFLQLVCVENQQEATPILRIMIHALNLVHTRTQQLLTEQDMLELP